jgi:PAS domain-containing protein
MTPIPRRHWLGYGVAVASTVLALLASIKLSELTSRPTFLLFFPAVMLSGWLAGLGPGLLADRTFRSVLRILPHGPRAGHFDVAFSPDALRLALFVIEGAFITALNEAFHRSRRRAADARAGESRATAAVADAEQRYRAFVENSSEAIWRFECEESIPTSLPEDEQIDRMYRVAYLAECNEAMARMYGFDRPADVIGARVGQMMPREVQANVDYLRAFIRSGYRCTRPSRKSATRTGTPSTSSITSSASLRTARLCARGALSGTSPTAAEPRKRGAGLTTWSAR